MSQHGDFSGLPGFCDRADRDSNGEIIHYGVQCDGCNMSPIKGPRFKCAVCSNFDLCGQCESFRKHNASHPLIKFNQPANRAVPPFPGIHEVMSNYGHGPHKWFGHHWKGRHQNGNGNCNGNGRRGNRCHPGQQHMSQQHQQWWQQQQQQQGVNLNTILQ